jgi:hypothetical protein
LTNGTENNFDATGQSFTGNGQYIEEVSLYLAKYGSPTGNITAKIYAHSGTYGTSSVPTGAALYTSDTVDIATLSTTFGLINFHFSTIGILNNGTNYVVTLSYNNGDANNYLKVGLSDVSATAHDGNYCYYSSFGGG